MRLLKTKSYIFLIIIFLAPFLIVRSQTERIYLISNPPSSIGLYEKYEVKFNVNTPSKYPFFEYDLNPPPGVQPGIGVSVEGVFTNLNSGKTYRQPAFFTTEVLKYGNPPSIYFVETANKYWVLRFTPRELGTYSAKITVRDSSGYSEYNLPSFSVYQTNKKGFIKVSKSDSRYFEFDNGELYFPIGPAWWRNNSFSQYKDSGLNYVRLWLGGLGIYSTNWSRWISSAERMGNEGYMTPLTYKEKAPGSELSYKLYYPEGYRLWQTFWGAEELNLIIKPYTKYLLKITFKLTGVTGPRNSNYPYGLVARVAEAQWGDPTIDQFENSMRNYPIILSHRTSTNNNWITVTTTFVIDRSEPNYYNWRNIYIYLENVTGGWAYIDEFSIKECLNSDCTLLGGEVIRNPKADQHTYVDPRGAAYFDYIVEEAERNGIYLQLVVHDKNDFIQNSLKKDGTWVDLWQGDGYYQPENTKARWLLRQWYRYLVARWGYSPAIFAWELNNEGPPYDINHWNTAQAFARYMKQIDSHPQLVSTSFWCCWVPTFGKNNLNYPDISYADVHEYTGDNPQVADANYTYDEVAFINSVSKNTFKDNIGKPIILGEHGISGSNWQPISQLSQPNPGVFYHNMLWAQLDYPSVFAANYWYSSHIDNISGGISKFTKIFSKFISDLNLNKGGYTSLNANVSNSKLRVFGQKNLNLNRAHLWIQNSDYTWWNVYNNYYTYQNGTITFTLNPNTKYLIERWDTYTGSVTTSTLTSDGSGNVSLVINNLQKDIAIKIYPLETTQPPSYPPLSVSCSATPNPAYVNQQVTFSANVSGGTGTYTYSWSGACSSTASTCSRTFTTPGTYTANLTVTSGSETKSTSCSVSVISQPAPQVSVDLKVNNSDGPITVYLPTNITLSWTSQNASSCIASGSWSGTKSTSGSQSISLSSAGTYTYTLTCSNPDSQASDSVTVNALQPPTTTTTPTTTLITKIYR
ncbi:MAG: PKD domain-containing protein, partial [Candidatus Micrarchaeia archaeon]